MADKLQQGRTAARVGDLAEARRLLTAAVKEMPTEVEVWLELAGVVDSLEEKKSCLEKVLLLDPDNAQAKTSLSLLKNKLASQPRAAEVPAESGPAFCYRHPQVETGLHCNRCNKAICAKCAQRTPVGFRCPDCMLEIEERYYSKAENNYLNPYDRPLTQPLFTYVLLGVIALVWLGQESVGGSEDGQTLIDLGANYGPLIMQGQVWRLFTSMFLHIGLAHLAFNSFSLFIFGLEVERLYGRYRFLVVYLLAGLFGSLASFALNGWQVFSAGASGAIFGIIGMHLAFFVFYRHRLGEFGRQQRKRMLTLVALNLVLGYSGMVRVDNYAHLGGLLAGFVLGYGLVPRYKIDLLASPRRIVDLASLLRRWWVPTLALVVLSGGLWLALSYWSEGWWWGSPAEAEPDMAEITYGQTVTDNLPPREADVWVFEGQAGETVTITMQGNEVDAYLYLYDEADEWLAEDDDSAGGHNARIDKYSLPTSGTYFIYAVNIENQPGAYNLALTLEDSP